MLNEIKAIEPELKQILYGCVEHVQATKAALYLSASHDLNDKKYEVVTSYQFNDAQRKVVHANDDLVDRLSVKRAGFYVNGLGADMRFSEMLFRQGTDRILATPLFARGRLLGFIDMRDKAGKRPFESPDVDAAKKIGDQVISLLGNKNLFGLAPIKLVDEPAQRVEPRALPQIMTPVRESITNSHELTPSSIDRIILGNIRRRRRSDSSHRRAASTLSPIAISKSCDCCCPPCSRFRAPYWRASARSATSTIRRRSSPSRPSPTTPWKYCSRTCRRG